MNIEEALKQAWVDAEKSCRYPVSMTQAEFVDFMFHRGYEFACDEKDAQHALRIALLDDCEDSNKTWNEIHLKDCEKISSLEEELKEQCRINAMGAQRELALLTKVSELEDNLYHASREAPSVEYKLNYEISKLKNVIAEKLSEDDEFGSEFVIKQILEDKISQLESALEIAEEALIILSKDRESQKQFLPEFMHADHTNIAEDALESIGKLLGGGENE